jgi:DNA polymerase-3 subunit delta'
MNNLLLSDRTKSQIGLIINNPPHALLITGNSGIGKTALAEHIAAELLGTSPEKLSIHPYFRRVLKPDSKQEIPIEIIREVTKSLVLKAPTSTNQAKRVVIIDEAHLMSAEAQNALLKAIEEPPPGTVFVLTTTSESAVLPTIASRTQKLKLGTVGFDESLAYFKDQYPEPIILSAWSLSGGAVGLMSAILSEDDQHQLKAAVEAAKKLLKQTRYERALYLDSLSGNKSDFTLLLDALSRILAALNKTSASSANSSSSHKLITARKEVNAALKRLETNASPRLIALDLAISLPV